jgi:predicted dehydrogenase
VVLAVGYQRRRESHFRWMRQEIEAGAFGKLVNAEANISRDRLGKIDLRSWRYTAEGMPGGVMLQIGIHYVDVLAWLLGPVQGGERPAGPAGAARRQPDVASLLLEHESGALSTLNASYASASEYYLMNLYGKDATAYYDLHGGLRVLKRGVPGIEAVPCAKNDTMVEELEEFAAAARGQGRPEVDGAQATRRWPCPRRHPVARERRRVEVRRSSPKSEGGLAWRPAARMARCSRAAARRARAGGRVSRSAAPSR